MWYVTAHSSAHMRCTYTQLNKPGLFGVKIAESFSLEDIFSLFFTYTHSLCAPGLLLSFQIDFGQTELDTTYRMDGLDEI